LQTRSLGGPGTRQIGQNDELYRLRQSPETKPRALRHRRRLDATPEHLPGAALKEIGMSLTIDAARNPNQAYIRAVARPKIEAIQAYKEHQDKEVQ